MKDQHTWPTVECLWVRSLNLEGVLLLGRRSLYHRGHPNHRVEGFQLVDPSRLLLLGSLVLLEFQTLLSHHQAILVLLLQTRA